MKWMRRRCCKKGNGANFFRGVKVERRDLRRAKEAISERGVRRSESEANKTKNDNKLEMAKETRNETKDTEDKKKVDSEMRKRERVCENMGKDNAGNKRERQREA